MTTRPVVCEVGFGGGDGGDDGGEGVEREFFADLYVEDDLRVVGQVGDELAERLAGCGGRRRGPAAR